MTGNWKSTITRRPFLAGFLAAFGVGIVGGGIYEFPKLFKKHYPPTPYDDLLALLPDRDAAVRLGKADAAVSSATSTQALAAHLRAEFGPRPLLEILEADLRSNRLVELKGWVLPESLVSLCTLAAKAT
jgi:hypothetical protein